MKFLLSLVLNSVKPLSPLVLWYSAPFPLTLGSLLALPIVPVNIHVFSRAAVQKYQKLDVLKQ